MKCQRRKQLLLASKFYSFNCFVLFIVNLVYLITTYMEYAVEIKIGPYFPLHQSFPKLTLCFNLDTVMSNRVPKFFFERHNPHFLNKSTGELFSKVPEVDKVLKKCHFRDPVTDEMVRGKNSTECTKIFSIKRFRMQSYICYTLDLEKTFDVYSVTHSLLDSRFLFSATINEPLDRGHVITPLIHLEYRPMDDRIFAQEYIPSLKSKHSLILSHYLYDVSRLKAPYETRCKPKSQLHCFYTCFNAYYNNLGISTTHAMEPDDPKWYHIRVQDLSNERLRKWHRIHLTKSKKLCNRLCKWQACEQKLVKTLISEQSDSKDVNFEIETSAYPVMKLKYEAKFEAFDFFTQCLSLASIWVGFSIFCFFTWRPRCKDKGNIKKVASNFRRVTSMLRFFFFKKTSSRKESTKRPEVRTKSKNQWIKLMSRAFSCLVFGLFLYQLYNVIYYYTKYETAVKFNFELNPKIENYPSIVVCFRVDDLFHTKMAVNTRESNYHKILTRRDSDMNHTLAELFNKSISDELLIGCRFRNFSATFLQFALLPAEDCRSNMKIEKFFHNRKICYKFTPTVKLKRRLRQSQMRFLSINPGMLYSIVLHPSVAPFTMHYLVMLDSSSDLLYSIEHTAKAGKGDVSRMHVLAYSKRRIQNLPRPYDTDCKPNYSLAWCFINCYSESISKINRIPYNLLESRPLKYKILSYTDLLNESINLYWQQLERKCNKCHRESCEYSFTKTYSNGLNRPEFDTEYIVGLAAYPTSTTTSIARNTLYDLYYQVACCLSFWLGFSAIAVNPVRLYHFKRMKRLVLSLRKRVSLMKHFVLPNVPEMSTTFAPIAYFKEKLREKLTRAAIMNVAIALVCLIVCVFHIVFSSIPYFSYPTIIECSRSLESSSDFSFSICLDAIDFLANKSQPSRDSIKLDSSILVNVSVKQLFNLLPETDEILDECAFWKLSSDVNRPADLTKVTDRIFFYYSNRTICNSLFKVRKILIQNKLCYQIYPSNPTNWNRNQFLNSIVLPRTLFAVSVPYSLLTPSFSVILSSTFRFPYISSNYVPRVLKSKYPNVYYFVSYTRYQQTVLLPPYSVGEFTHMYMTKCFERCTENYFNNRNLTLFGGYEAPVDNLHFITSVERNDPVISWNIHKVTSECKLGCQQSNKYYWQNETEYSFTVTQTSKEFKGGGNGIVEFNLKSTDDLVMSTKFKEAITLCDLIINIGSIISVWFGLSALASNPFTKTMRKETTHLLAIEMDLRTIESVLVNQRIRVRSSLASGAP